MAEAGHSQVDPHGVRGPSPHPGTGSRGNHAARGQVEPRSLSLDGPQADQLDGARPGPGTTGSRGVQRRWRIFLGKPPRGPGGTYSPGQSSWPQSWVGSASLPEGGGARGRGLERQAGTRSFGNSGLTVWLSAVRLPGASGSRRGGEGGRGGEGRVGGEGSLRDRREQARGHQVTKTPRGSSRHRGRLGRAAGS